jgi:tetratricopeptide (TPR) repeat protein
MAREWVWLAGNAYLQLGHHDEAQIHLRQGLSLCRQAGDLIGQARIHNNLATIGYAYHHLRRYTEAIACYQRAIELYREDAPSYRSASLTNLGDAHHAAGKLDAAREAWQEALGILDQLHHPDADQVRARLDNATGWHEVERRTG